MKNSDSSGMGLTSEQIIQYVHQLILDNSFVIVNNEGIGNTGLFRSGTVINAVNYDTLEVGRAKMKAIYPSAFDEGDNKHLEAMQWYEFDPIYHVDDFGITWSLPDIEIVYDGIDDDDDDDDDDEWF